MGDNMSEELKEIYENMKLRVEYAKKEDCVEYVVFEDMDEKEPFVGHYPRYEINVKFKEGVTEEEEEAFLDKYFQDRDFYIDNLEVFVVRH